MFWGTKSSFPTSSHLNRVRSRSSPLLPCGQPYPCTAGREQDWVAEKQEAFPSQGEGVPGHHWQHHHLMVRNCQSVQHQTGAIQFWHTFVFAGKLPKL